MSRHARKIRESEDREGGRFPTIGIDNTWGVWLCWVYRVAPFQVSVMIPLTVAAHQSRLPWLFVDGNDSELGNEETRTHAEAQYGAMTRVRLMEAHKAAIVEDEAAGLAQLEAAATAAGLYGRREPRRCVIPTWTTHDETGVANNSLGNN